MHRDFIVRFLNKNDIVMALNTTIPYYIAEQTLDTSLTSCLNCKAVADACNMDYSNFRKYCSHGKDMKRGLHKGFFFSRVSSEAVFLREKCLSKLFQVRFGAFLEPISVHFEVKSSAICPLFAVFSLEDTFMAST